MSQLEKRCEAGDKPCDRPFFNNAPKSKKPACSGHYQRERRAMKKEGGEQPVGDVREYGVGHNRVSGSVSDENYKVLEAEAKKHHDGSMYALVREVMTIYAQGIK